jgi:hypothetical protein
VTTAQNAPALAPRTQSAPQVAGTTPQTAPAPASPEIAAGSAPAPGTAAASAPAPGQADRQAKQPQPQGAISTRASEIPAPGTQLAAPDAGAPTTAAPAASSPVLQAGQVITIYQADKLQAPPQDVATAKGSVPLEHKPDPAPAADVDNLRTAMRLPSRDDPARNHDGQDWRGPDPGGSDPGGPDHGQHDWDHQVRQWDRDWVQYDQDWRPIICNPYENALQVVYVYQDAPQIVVIPPLASAVLDVPDYGAYSFTAAVLDAVGQAVDVAVGSFFGGGYDPGPGLPPPPPPPVQTYNDVPVAVDYPDATYQPFLVNQVVDAGNDPQYGEDKVLLDGVTPVWGQWTQTPDGQRQFEVHKTQQFPGLDTPAPGPLPGNYHLQLASTASPRMPARDVFIVAATAVVATLGICGAFGFAIARRRRVPARH